MRKGAGKPRRSIDEANRLVLDNLGLAKTFAVRLCRRYHGRKLDETLSLAFEGLMLASRQWDATRGVAFSTYAFQAMFRMIAREWKHGQRVKRLARVAIIPLPVRDSGECLLGPAGPDRSGHPGRAGGARRDAAKGDAAVG